MACKNWTVDIKDTGLISEETLISKIHPQGIQPQTEGVQVNKTNNSITLFSNTKGASIGYKILKDDVNPDNLSWMIYSEPVTLNANEKLLTIAHRIGYLPSKILKYDSE